jgi:hypothetical protein
MITFKEFLFEKKMTPGTYASTFKRLEDDAKIGFEIEVFVPEGTFFHAGPDESPGKRVALKDIGTWSEIQTYFNVTKQQESAVIGDFTEWQTNKEKDWVDENWLDFVTDEESRSAERDARKRALRKTENKFSFHEWLATFKGLGNFLTAYDLEPSHGWADDDQVRAEKPQEQGYESGFKNTADQLAVYLSRALKEKVVVNGTGYASWNLTHDTSIKDSEGRSDEEDQDGYGVEIVSPPQPPSKALEQLAIVFDILNKYDIETNESTGVHVNISLENLEAFDPLKLVLFMGDEHILKKFDRTTNTFTNSQLRRVVDSISTTGKIPKAVDELIALGREGLKETGKYFSVNLLHLPKYLEFRAAGGADYHKRLHDIREVTGRWLTAVEIAAKPDLYRKEYLKKVMKLIDKTGEAETRESHKDLTFQQMLFKTDGKMAWDMLQDALAGDDPEYKLRAVRVVLLTLNRHIDDLQPTLSNMKEFRAMFKQAGVTPSQVLADKEPTRALAIAEVLKKFKLQAKPA